MKMNKFWIPIAAVVLCCFLWVCGNSKAGSIGTDLNETRWGSAENIGGLANVVTIFEFYDSLNKGSGKAHLAISVAGYRTADEYGSFTVNTKKQTICYSSSEGTTNLKDGTMTLKYNLTNGHVSSLSIGGNEGTSLQRIK